MKLLLKKTVGLAAMVAVLAASTMACGKTETDAVPAKTETSGGEEKQVIKIVHYMGEQAKRDGLDLMLKEFKKTHPDVEFDVQAISAAQYITMYKTRISAGDAPDLFFGKPRVLKEFVDGGHFMDITDAECMKNVLPILKEECSVDGKVYGFPLDAQVKATFYNKKMFEENGIEVPKTKDEFFAVCDAFEEKGILPMIHGYNNINCVFHELDAYFTSQAVAEGVPNTWVDSQNGSAKLEGNPTVKSALEQYSKMASYKDQGDLALDQPQAIQDFAAEKRPMFTNGGWIMGDVAAANPEGEFGMFPTPWSNNPEENKLWIGIDDVFIVSNTTDKKDLVLELLNSFASEESSKIWMDNAKLMSSNMNVSVENADPFIQEIKQYIDSDDIVAKSLVGDYTAEYLTAFRTQLQHFVTLEDEQRDVDALIKSLDTEIEGIRN